MDYVFLDTADSTMSYASAHQHDLGDMTMVSVHQQQAGRGQRGNSWESQPGKNLTVTLFRRPALDDTSIPLPVRQFRISEATALAVADTLADHGITATLKWPNDIYVGNLKICGILIEHSVLGCSIANSRIGIGFNVNQREFESEAPNPVSMTRITGREYSLPAVLDSLSFHLERRLGNLADVHTEYLTRLWRHDGAMYPFRPRKSNLSASHVQADDPDIFLARIDGVAPDGIISLITRDNRTMHFSFKELEFIL